MSPFEDPEDISSRYSWHYRAEYEGFCEKHEAIKKYELLKKSILENQETFTLVTPKTPSFFDRLLSVLKKCSIKEKLMNVKFNYIFKVIFAVFSNLCETFSLL
ncbi:MAG: hypothetical protein HRU09_12315 [Oligoflexales bacterium]|nr:hypothetical protein [Oligoflexales bacterium]